MSRKVLESGVQTPAITLATPTGFRRLGHSRALVPHRDLTDGQRYWR